MGLSFDTAPYKEEKNNISLLFKAGIEIQFFYNNWIQ